jgi:3-deoxy-D-arabino-heptulosonate 7-phosphate (DAHP) synthase class II
MSSAAELSIDAPGFLDADRSGVDPRLNYEQALECAMRIARGLREGK